MRVAPILLVAVALAGCARGDRAASAAAPILVDGDCSKGRPIGPLTNYAQRVRLRLGAGGFVRVRATPEWSSEDHSNVIGTLRTTDAVAAYGPMKGEPSNGIGWVVPLVDGAGTQCRGYVSATVVAEVRCDRSGARPEAFPDPLDTTSGACVDTP